MDDAGGDCIERHARAAEKDRQSVTDHGGEASEVLQPIHETQAHLDPTRWWFASSAFPMMAGTLGPVASAFSICALVRPWRQHMPPGTNISQAEFVQDPTYLIAVNAVQLAVAIVANLFLLLNMARRIRFTIAMPVTIVGWYLSSICLICLAATAAGPLVLQPAEEYIWSQAFFYGIYAALLYFIVATLLVVTAYGAHIGRYGRDFQLTASQRTLMLQTIMFLMYLLVGALIFSSIEGWAYLDAVYWADVTLFTVGFGDMGAATPLGRGLLFPYALVGIISLGLVIGSIRSLVLERGRRMINARMIEKKRRHTVKRLTKKGQVDILAPVRNGTEEQTEHSNDPSNPAEIARRQKEFQLMRQIQAHAANRRRWVAMALSSTTWIVLWLLGAYIFQVCEAPYQGWGYFDGVYFAFVSLTTIGYGDVTPISNPGRSFFVFWSLLALPTTTVLISNAGDTIVKSIRDLTDRIGEVTILPGDKNVVEDVKSIVRRLSLGKLFNEGEEKTDGLPPGFLGQARIRRSSDDTDSSERSDGDDVEPTSKSKDVGTGKEKATAEGSRSQMKEKHPRQKEKGPAQNDGAVSREAALGFPKDLPTSRAAYHVVLIDEIARVAKHMKQKPTKTYSFVEWAWYLRLIGEDESNPEIHRQAQPHARDHHHHPPHLGRKEMHGNESGENGRRTSKDEEISDKPGSWSWIGSRSPLMGRQDEAEWIHAKLVMKLSEELRAKRDEEKEFQQRETSSSQSSG
ncbi:hypothetical protein MCOR27_001281 [Pyricularia oryzae]|uniref:Potassium channel domain-containing protein n=2 Tax=Pyricularia TaxID=48558 RepID=A0ABQ8NWK9_PYRGI|nr:hypothetical protein MCOR02_006312 [Pyricularia oryzae]KAI6301857.1 hypothetical protein MCOR33_002696 [Pyricularia grisea]KAI6280787.1 hypothetical protein MCOR26_003550 [Pyricularia oryzae]KAI6287715.1 hypothetical protein MCOR27_001281 [Pyricularia oryzae]KAI6306271.1 hypothetical protein MCOR34_008142 [Pyricularia oryzae]